MSLSERNRTKIATIKIAMQTPWLVKADLPILKEWLEFLLSKTEELDTEKAEPGWIKCSERMPTKEDGGETGTVLWFTMWKRPSPIRLAAWDTERTKAHYAWCSLPPLPKEGE